MSTAIQSAGSSSQAIALTTSLTVPRLSGALAMLQTSSLDFTRSSASNYDSTARVGDAGIHVDTTKLTLALSLLANRSYNFSFYFPSGGPKVTLTDSAGKVTSVTMAKGFSVAKSGTYQLTFDAPYSLKSAGFDNLAINSRAVLPKSSGDKRIDALLMGGTANWWRDWDASAVQSTQKVGATNALVAGSSATELTFSFLDAAPSGQSMTGFQAMTDAQKDAVRRAFDAYSKVINVKFTEVSSAQGGNINFGTNNQTSSAGYATMPNSSAEKDKAYLFLANNQASNNDAGMQEGGYGYLTLLHEIGHTLGLKHPGNYNAGGGGAPAPYLSAAEDNRQKTIMAYSDNNFSRGVRATTPMLYDVAALQYLYGANASGTTAVDGAFTFKSGQNTLQTLWSATGTDRIDLSELTRSSQIDLNGGTYSSINILGPASSGSYSGNQNVAIAYGAKIDRVKLSAQTGVADSVTLNDAFKRDAFNVIDSFDTGADFIALKKSLFGSLKSQNLQIGTSSTASSSTSRIIVNSSTGEIFYDADGSGTRSVAKKIAQYTAISGQLSASNFSFVA